jgi:hypothetical protein
MCMMCDGATRDEALRSLHQKIDRRGFTVMSVGSSYDHRGWAYTIGLVDRLGHPELVIAGLVIGQAAVVLAELATDVLSGLHLDGGSDCITWRGAPPWPRPRPRQPLTLRSHGGMVHLLRDRRAIRARASRPSGGSARRGEVPRAPVLPATTRPTRPRVIRRNEPLRAAWSQDPGQEQLGSFLAGVGEDFPGCS